MVKNINKILSGVLFLILAICQCVLLGAGRGIALITIICMVMEAVMSYFLYKDNKKVMLLYLGTAAAELLFLFTREFIVLAMGIFLLIAAGVWNIYSIKQDKKKIPSLMGKTLYGIFVVLTGALLIINIYIKPITKSVELPDTVSAKLDESLLDSKSVMLKNIETMNSFGSRTTGSAGQNEFIGWLKEQLTALGLEVHSDKYTFDSWEEIKSALYINGEEVHVSSAYPYSGETGENGVIGELVYTKAGKYDNAKGKIAVIQIDNTSKIPLGIVMNERNSVFTKEHLVTSDGDLVLTTALQDPELKKAKEKGVLAVILVWKGVSDGKAEDQYLSFISDYAGIPAVWVNETDGEKVIRAAKNKEQGTVILQAKKQKNAETESFYVSIPGKNDKESIIVNSHTDGVNVVEENGPVGMLSMIRYWQNFQPERTMVFAFITGHFRLPYFQGTSQATSTWMQAHPELWDGKEGHLKAAAGITAEHLGSLEWKDREPGEYTKTGKHEKKKKYEKTGKIQTEYTYTGNEMMSAIWRKAIEGRQTQRTVILRGHNRFEFGESQPLFEAGIPVIGFIPMPDYLLVNSESREMDKFDVSLMHEQVAALLKASILIDQMTAEQLGASDRYSFFYGKTK